jgi:hypothetical protein
MEISLSDLKSLMANQPMKPDKDYGWIVLILRNGFVFVGETERRDGIGYLKGFQVRYWKQRDGGLPEFAAKGTRDGDKLDTIEGCLEFPWSDQNVIGVLSCGKAWTK